MAESREDLLQKPLYIFDLPKQILANLSPKHQDAQTEIQSSQTVPRESRSVFKDTETEEKSEVGSKSCALCSQTFANIMEQRSHVRSDLHGYNLKQKLKGLKPVSEDEFEKLVADIDESISGSDSVDSEASTEDEDESGAKNKDSTLTALLKKQARIAGPEDEDLLQRKRQRGAGKPPLLWFTSSVLPSEVSLGMYRAIFTNIEQQEDASIIDTIRRKQLPSIEARPKEETENSETPPKDPASYPHYFLCMIGGGHFAAMVVSLVPKIGKRHAAGLDERQATVLAHKTFHRYTTRRKQGGAQSASDNAKGAAHSAGSSLRRYNEVALTNEVRELLAQWKDLIDSSELLFVRATGNTNRRVLYGPYEDQVLRHKDPRIRSFPFSTRRATQRELMRAFVELTRVKVSRVSEEALESTTPAASSRDQSPARTSKKKTVTAQKASKEDEENALHTTQLTALIRRSKVPALLNYISTNSIDLKTFHFHPPNHHTPTPLHLAASLNSAPVVLALLVKTGADPASTGDDSNSRLPFSLAGDRATRDAFRQARGELGESTCDWDAAGVPTALTKSEIAQRSGREKAEKEAEDKKEAERRKIETERLRKETEQEERAKRAGKGRYLGREAAALPKTAEERREEEARGMTPEMRAKLERERRARAAEERIRRMTGGQ